MRPTSRLGGLDASRGCAAVAVMLSHYPLSLFGQRWFPTADLAVDLFYCLSGVVLWLHFAPRLAQGMGPKRFMLERLIRVYPLYLVALSLGALAIWVEQQAHVARIDLAEAFWHALLLWPYQGHSDLLLGKHVLHDEIFPLNGVCWSLYFELIAGCSLFLWRHIRSWRGMVVPLLILMFLWTRWSAWTQTPMAGGWDWSNAHMGLPRALFSFGMGVMICRLWQAGATPAWLRRGVPQVGMVALMALLMWTPYQWFRHSGHLVTLATLLIIPTLVLLNMHTPESSSRPFAWLGNISYPIYLLHVPVYLLIEQLGHLALGVPYGAWGTVALAVASTALLSRWLLPHVDLPARNWLKRTLLKPDNSSQQMSRTE